MMKSQPTNYYDQIDEAIKSYEQSRPYHPWVLIESAIRLIGAGNGEKFLNVRCTA